MFNLLNQRLLGIINVTPNSFSDGSDNLTLSKIQKKIGLFEKFGIVRLDFGAESTAPTNQSIDAMEEIKRLENYLLPMANQLAIRVCSFDTYHLETIQFIMEKIVPKVLEKSPSSEIWWNDVSGKLDSDVLMLLNKYQKLKYVYCHNLAPTRELSSKHMDYLWDDFSTIKMFEYFSKNLSGLENNVKSRTIIDPTFGFSKTRDQNLYLMKDISKLINMFDENVVWLLGISRKSFLRDNYDNSLKDANKYKKADQKQNEWIKVNEDLFLKRIVYIRLHQECLESVKN